MGLKYLDGKTWAEITREERFFCARLFERIKAEGAHSFVEWLCSTHGFALDPGHAWEVAYEACFYRDIWQHRRKASPLYSPKRTFDLALLSDDAVVIVEAKAQQPFDEEQANVFALDREQVIKETGVRTVLVLGLCSSRCSVPPGVKSVFDGRILTWKELSARYDDPVLARADDIYEESAAFASYGRNNASGKLTGAELVEAHARGERFFVGRGGGLDGPNVRTDVTTGGWRNQRYETNRKASSAPNANWFSLDDYV
ncbi:MAG TPA: hypothetical protein VGC79_05945, partial [Polyangiaceae bacterium]